VIEGMRGLFEARQVPAVHLDEFDDKPAVLDFLSGYGFDLMAPARLKAFAPAARCLRSAATLDPRAGRKALVLCVTT
jgi:hypothetical protein